MRPWHQFTGRDRRLTRADLQLLGQSVTDAEAGTAAEIVVAVRSHSGNYRDVDYLFGAVIAWLGLLLVLFTPWPIATMMVPLEVPLLFAGGAWMCAVTPLRRWLTRATRRTAQVRDAAAAAFVEEGVSHTRGRTGVLVYWSLLERQVHVLADVGIHTIVPSHDWHAILFSLRQDEANVLTAPALAAQITALGRLLSRYLPAAAHEVNELPNRPRVLS